MIFVLKIITLSWFLNDIINHTMPLKIILCIQILFWFIAICLYYGMFCGLKFLYELHTVKNIPLEYKITQIVKKNFSSDLECSGMDCYSVTMSGFSTNMILKKEEWNNITNGQTVKVSFKKSKNGYCFFENIIPI